MSKKRPWINFLTKKAKARGWLSGDDKEIIDVVVSAVCDAFAVLFVLFAGMYLMNLINESCTTGDTFGVKGQAVNIGDNGLLGTPNLPDGLVITANSGWVAE